MKERITDLPVNWMDGMKVNKDHFIITDNYVAMQLKKLCSVFLNPYNYGLLCLDDGKTPSLNLQTYLDNQGYIHVRVVNIAAITRDGTRMDITTEGYSETEHSAVLPHIKFDREEGSRESLYICLSVHLQERVPFGTPDPDEKPPRLPNVIPGYHLSVHTQETRKSATAGNSLIIGKLNFSGDKPELDESFIPACHTTGSHPRLEEHYFMMVKLLGQLEVDVVDILHNINDKKQTTSIAATVAGVADAILGFLGTHVDGLRKSGRYQAPVVLFELMSALARTINNSINKQSSADKEELYNYIEDWSSLKQGEFETMLRETTECIYDHDDICRSLEKLTLFIKAVSRIFNTLSSLNFIGKKKDRQIFVKEQKEKPGSSFLVD